MDITLHMKETHRMTPYLEKIIEKINDEKDTRHWSRPFSTPDELTKHLRKVAKKS